MMKKENQIKFYNLTLKQPNDKYNGYLQVAEDKRAEGYGNKTYINITHFDKTGIIKYNFWHIDCRYMKNYQMTKAVKQFAKNYFGNNLEKIELIKQTKIIK